MTQETERGTLFVMLPFSLLSCGLSHGAIVLYAHLLRYAGGKDTCWPAVHPPIPQGGRCTTGDTSHVPPAVHGSIYSEEDRKMIDGAAPQTTTPLTSTTQGDRLSVQAVTICGILGLVETDGQVAAVRRIVEAVGAEAQNGTIDPVGEARKLRERSESPTLNAYRGWLNKALTFARERSRPAAQPMVPIAVRPLSAEITQIEGREARLRRQYPKWSPEADRAWVMKKDKQAGERPPWLT
jgi:hypothetical protein